MREEVSYCMEFYQKVIARPDLTPLHRMFKRVHAGEHHCVYTHQKTIEGEKRWYCREYPECQNYIVEEL